MHNFTTALDVNPWFKNKKINALTTLLSCLLNPLLKNVILSKLWKLKICEYSLICI